jgi:hypothetical protein
MNAINIGCVYNYTTKPWDIEGVRIIVRKGIEIREITRAIR